jgi:hypothetical protein
LAVLSCAALTSGCADQHLKVKPLSGKLAVVLRNDHFDKQNPLTSAGRGAHVAQNVHSVIVGPVVNHVLESSVSGPGKRTDALMRTNGRIRSMIFAEIKHHRTSLVDKEYRSGCWSPSPELSGGVVQIQQTVHLATREIQGRLADKDDRGVETGEHTYVVRPRSFLIAGSLDQLRQPSGVHRQKYESFELYRRNLYEPEIVTFDELLARAEWQCTLLEDSPGA